MGLFDKLKASVGVGGAKLEIDCSPILCGGDAFAAVVKVKGGKIEQKLTKLEVFEDEIARRREIAMRYDGMLHRYVTVPTIPEDFESAFALYTIRVPERDRVRAILEEQGIGTGIFYRLALHQHPAFRDGNKRPLPVSERLAGEVLSLPIHPDLSDDEVERVIEAVIDAVG